METKANDPIHNVINSKKDYSDDNIYKSNGLTKREYFASMALQAFITKYGIDCQEQHTKQAVFMAEFLIEELNKTKTDD